MPLRETLLNLAIAAVLVLIVVLGGLLLRESRPGPVPAIPVKVAGVPGRTLPDEGGRAKAVTETFQVFPKPELVESRANEADTLRIRLGNEEHIFVLYFVDALEATMNHPQRVAAQGRFFGRASDALITEVGREAAAYVADLLKTRPFNVLTRWERVPNTLRYYALIVVADDAGRPVYLADLLLRKGYAMPGSVNTDLPNDGRDLPTYVVELKRLMGQARQDKAGIWARIQL